MPPRPLHQRDPIARAFLADIGVDRGYSPRTVETYAYALDRGLEAMSRARGEPVTVATAMTDDLRAWLRAEHAAGVSAASRALWLTAWHSCCRYARTAGLRADNPAADLPIPKRPKRLPRPLREADTSTLLDAPWGRPWPGARNLAVCELLYGAGLRISGVCALNVDDIDLEAATVRVIAKGNREEVKPLLPTAVVALRAYLAVRALRLRGLGVQRALFFGRGTRRLRPAVMRHVLTRRAQRLGLPHTWPHRLRTSCATHLSENGADLGEIQALMGHARPETTVRYTLVTARRLGRVVQRAHPRAAGPVGPADRSHPAPPAAGVFHGPDVDRCLHESTRPSVPSQATNGHTERPRELRQDNERGALAGALELRDVGPVEPGLGGQGFLGEAGGVAQCSEPGRELPSNLPLEGPLGRSLRPGHSPAR